MKAAQMERFRNTKGDRIVVRTRRRNLVEAGIPNLSVRRSQKAQGQCLRECVRSPGITGSPRRMHPDRLHRQSPTRNVVTSVVSPGASREQDITRMTPEGRTSDQANVLS